MFITLGCFGISTPSFIELFFYIFLDLHFIHINILPLCIMSMPTVHKVRKWGSNLLELELQTVAVYFGGARNRTQSQSNSS